MNNQKKENETDIITDFSKEKENEDQKNLSKSQKTYEFVFDHFSRQIMNGAIKIGDKLPTERDIAEKLGVSRNSVREVMHMMEINGLIECVQGSGNYVRCNPVEYMKKTVNMLMPLMGIEYTEIFHIRTGYELVALRLAIETASEDELEGIHEALLMMDQMDHYDESSYWDNEFHRRLLLASHNRLLILYYSMISDMMNQFIKDLRRRILSEQSDKDALSRSHWSIYDALVNKDYMSGTIAMNKHFEIVAKALFKQ